MTRRATPCPATNSGLDALGIASRCDPSSRRDRLLPPSLGRLRSYRHGLGAAKPSVTSATPSHPLSPLCHQMLSLAEIYQHITFRGKKLPPAGFDIRDLLVCQEIELARQGAVWSFCTTIGQIDHRWNPSSPGRALLQEEPTPTTTSSPGGFWAGRRWAHPSGETKPKRPYRGWRRTSRLGEWGSKCCGLG